MKTLGKPSKENMCGFVTTTAYKQLEHDLKLSLALALGYLNFVCENKEFCINCPLNKYLKKDQYGKIIGGCEVLDLINEASKFGIEVGD